MRPSEKSLEYPLNFANGSIVCIDGVETRFWGLEGQRFYAKRLFLEPAFFETSSGRLHVEGDLKIVWNVLAGDAYSAQGLWSLPDLRDLA